MQYHSKINIYFYFFSFVDFFFLLIVLYFHLQMKNHHAFIQEGTTIPFCLRPGKWKMADPTRCSVLPTECPKVPLKWMEADPLKTICGTGQPLTRLADQLEGNSKKCSTSDCKGDWHEKRLKKLLWLHLGPVGSDGIFLSCKWKKKIWYWLLHESWFLIWGS